MDIIKNPTRWNPKTEDFSASKETLTVLRKGLRHFHIIKLEADLEDNGTITVFELKVMTLKEDEDFGEPRWYIEDEVEDYYDDELILENLMKNKFPISEMPLLINGPLKILAQFILEGA